MRLVLFIYLLSLFSFIPAQTKYATADARARAVKEFSGLDDLSKKLTKNARNDLEKVRSIFYWTTQNITYDYTELRSDSNGSYYEKVKDYLTANPPKNYDSVYNKMVLDTVMERRAGLCDGYARLVKTICTYNNIKAECVIGMAKKFENIGKEQSNHAWNAVWLDNKWQLLDACWGRGIRDSLGTKSVKKIDEFYFLPDPRAFSFSHYPEEKRFFLHSPVMSKQQFVSMPIVYPAFFDFGFENFNPNVGTLTTKNDNMIVTLIKTVPLKDPEAAEEHLTLKKTELRYYYEQKIEQGQNKVTVFYKGKSILQYALKKT